MSSLALTRTLYTQQGATFTYGFVYHEPELDVDDNVVLDDDGNPVPGDPKDLTGVLARLQIRTGSKPPGDEVIVNATSLDPASEEAIAEGAGRIFLQSGAVQGRIDIVLTDLDTELLTMKKAVYDLELEWPIQSGEIRPFVERILEGQVINTLNVTRDLAEDDEVTVP